MKNLSKIVLAMSAFGLIGGTIDASGEVYNITDVKSGEVVGRVKIAAPKNSEQDPSALLINEGAAKKKGAPFLKSGGKKSSQKRFFKMKTATEEPNDIMESEEGQELTEDILAKFNKLSPEEQKKVLNGKQKKTKAKKIQM